MKCVLMNKNVEVLILEYNEEYKEFDEIYEFKNIKYAPYGLCNDNRNVDKLSYMINLNEWFNERAIPLWRDKLEKLLYNLNIKNPLELLNKAYGLSLTDQYWIKPFESNLKYEDINFFDNDFNYTEFLDVSILGEAAKVKSDNFLETPNNTTDGMVTKAWVIENGERFLIKSAFKGEVLGPFNEVLASMISNRLGFDYVPYTIEIYKNKIVSKCPCFINKNTEFITAYQIMKCNEKHRNFKDYETYVNTLSEMGIENARGKVENMFILDYLIMNEDRHMNNFGIIRDVNTLKWFDVAPIFDNGDCLKIQDYGNEITTYGYGRVFYDIVPFDDMLYLIENLNRIDTSKLDGIVEDYKALLYKYQNYTNLTERKINIECFILQRQINKLTNRINLLKSEKVDGRRR